MVIKLIQPAMDMRPMDTKLKTRMSPPLGLLTIANLFYREHTVIIENENIREINYDEYVDIVGISITVDVLPRAIEIAKKFREKGIIVVAGGIKITACSQWSLNDFDVFCVGMAEKTWLDIINVISDIKAIGKKHIMFIDDNFIDNPKWTMEFVRAILCSDLTEMMKLLSEKPLIG